MTTPTFGAHADGSVFVAKLKTLHDRGFERCGVLLCETKEPARFAGVTGFGKVIWWPHNPPSAHGIVDRLRRHREALIGGAHPTIDTTDLLDEAAAEIEALMIGLRFASDAIAKRPGGE